MRKWSIFLLSCLFVVSGMAFAQDATEEAAMAVDEWVCPDWALELENRQLNVYNWSTYVAEDTISNFETLCNAAVTYDTFESNEAALSRLRQGNPGYDIVVPTGQFIPTMADEGLLVELDLSLIPNFANLSEGLLGPVYDPDNLYSVPYQWGTIGVGYNQEVVGEEITSWEQVFNYDGPVAWLEDTRAMVGIALVMLGYDPNTSNPDEIAEARDFLIDNGANVVYIAGDDGQERLAAGEVDIAIEYMGDIFQIIADCECETYAFALPMEGSQVWVDNLSIPAGAQNPDLAHAFIDYILNAQVGADIANYTAYASPNQVAIDAGLIDEAYLSSPAIYPDPSTFERLFSIVNDPEAEQLFNDAWDEVKILLGR